MMNKFVGDNTVLFDLSEIGINYNEFIQALGDVEALDTKGQTLLVDIDFQFVGFASRVLSHLRLVMTWSIPG